MNKEIEHLLMDIAKWFEQNGYYDHPLYERIARMMLAQIKLPESRPAKNE